ncbi:nitroreductase family protein [Microbacterium sp. gxy059]|uniref:nitroreductase family protein n=1 Tax=Microbacterium sp. gxy059 TaxID=2957199 RepID=UPI003D99856C
MTASAVRTADPALAARYGGAEPPDAAPANDVVGLLYRHRSVRQFAQTPVADDVLTTIVAAAQSAATSSHLQSWSVIEVRDPERRARVAQLAGEQAFIRDAGAFLVFVADLSRNRRIADRRGEPSDGLDFVDSTLTAFVDAGVAAQNAVVAAESLGLGTAYVGSVRNEADALADLLGLPEAAFPVVGVAIGYPSAEATTGVKPRLPQHVVRHVDAYAPASDDDIAAYDRTVAAYYATQGAERAWTPSVLKRVRDAASLHGRHELRSALERRGLPSR